MAEVTGNGSSGNIINYGVSSKEGKIYRSSKTEEEGFRRIEMQNGGVTFHKYLDGLSGKITYVKRDEKEIQKDGKPLRLDNLKIFLNDGEVTQALSLSTYSQEWKLFIKHLYNVDFSKNLEISYYKKKVGERAYLNCIAKYADEKNEDGKNKLVDWLDCTSVSKGGKVPDATKNRKNEWDWTDNDLWYLDRQVEFEKRFEQFKNTNGVTPPIPQPTSQAPQQASQPTKEEDASKLPF